MSAADDLERAIEQLHITTKAETDKRILNDASVALRRAMHTQAGIGARVWRAVAISRIARPAVIAAAILMTFALFFGIPGEKAVTVERIYGALGKAENICISRFQGDQTEPYQQMWTSQSLKVKVLKTGSGNQVQFALWDIPNRVQMIRYLSPSPVQTEPITDQMLVKLEASMTPSAGLVPFADAADVPEEAQWNRVEDRQVRATVSGAEVYELTWVQKDPASGAVIFRKWRVFVETRTNLPKRAEWYTKSGSEEEYRLETSAVVAYPTESEIQDFVRNTFGPPGARPGEPEYMGTPEADR